MHPRYPLNKEALEKAIRRRGWSEEAFCRRVVYGDPPGRRLSPRTLRSWKSGAANPQLCAIDAMARVLGLEPGAIADLEASEVDDVPTVGAAHRIRYLLRDARILPLARRVALAFFDPYTRHVSLSLHSPSARFHHDLENPGWNPPGYASLEIRDGSPSGRWIFSFVLFGVRVDFGHVEGRGSTARLVEYFTARRETATAPRGQPLRVATWFDRERCRFVVRSDTPFEVAVLPRGSPVHLGFELAPHHRRGLERLGLDPDDFQADRIQISPAAGTSPQSCRRPERG